MSRITVSSGSWQDRWRVQILRISLGDTGRHRSRPHDPQAKIWDVEPVRIREICSSHWITVSSQIHDPSSVKICNRTPRPALWRAMGHDTANPARAWRAATGRGCRPVRRAHAGVVLLPPLPTQRHHTMILILGCSPFPKVGERLTFWSRGGSQPSGSGPRL